MIEQTRFKDITEYLLIIALYYVTGGAFSYTNYSLQITLFLVLSFILCLLTGRLHCLLRQRPFLALFFMSFFVMLVPLIQGDSISTYLSIVMQLAIGGFCAAIVPVEHFQEKYIKIIVWFAAVSLAFFSIGLVMPSVAMYFPLTIGSASVDYYNAGIYVFMQPKGFGDFRLMVRNAGICWEPGCYQMFLNIALFFLLEKEKEERQKHFSLYFSCLVVTVITTMSTTGLALMLLILAVYFNVWIQHLKHKWLILPVTVLGIVYIAEKTGMVEWLLIKITREFGEEKSFIDRLSLNRIEDIFFPERGFPYILGRSFRKWLETDKKLWNSIIHSFLCLGIPFTLIHLRGYWLGTKVLARKSWLLIVIMLLSASTETVFWRVLFNTFTFYGWIYSKTISQRVITDCERVSLRGSA